MAKPASADQPTPHSIAGYVKQNAALTKKTLTARHGHGPMESIREAEHGGHRIVITTSYEVQVDGRPLHSHFIVTDDGQVQCHAMPNYTFSSAVDLVKAMIDVFPEEFPRRKQSGRPSRRSGGDHGHHH